MEFNLLYANRQTRMYNFTPQSDITALEAAYLAHFFASLPFLSGTDYEHWDKIKRHLTLIDGRVNG